MEQPTESTLRAALEHVRKFLTSDQWGTIDYMERSHVYGEIDQVVAVIDAALQGKGTSDA